MEWKIKINKWDQMVINKKLCVLFVNYFASLKKSLMKPELSAES